MQKAVFDYVDGGAEDEVTHRQNCGNIQKNDVPSKLSGLGLGLGKRQTVINLPSPLAGLYAHVIRMVQP